MDVSDLTLTGGKTDDINELYLYKAKKYHSKIHQLIKQMKKDKKQIPEGYDQFTVSFDEYIQKHIKDN